MASLTLKKIPESLHAALREAAAADRRSLNQEIIHLLAVGLLVERRDDRSLGRDFVHQHRDAFRTLAGRSLPDPPVPDVEAQLAAWRRLAGKWLSDLDERTEANELIAQRSPGREVDL